MSTVRSGWRRTKRLTWFARQGLAHKFVHYEAMPDVRLVDLEVIKRYSLAVRRDAVPADELLAALDASRDTVLAAMAPPKRTAKTKVAEAEARRASSRKLA